jgi:hypothetical protein
MMELEKKPAGAGKEKNCRFGQRSGLPKSTYKSKGAGLEDGTFDVGTSSDLASLASLSNTLKQMYK